MTFSEQTFTGLVGTGGVVITPRPGHVLRVTEEPEPSNEPAPPDPRGRPGQQPTA